MHCTTHDDGGGWGESPTKEGIDETARQKTWNGVVWCDWGCCSQDDKSDAAQLGAMGLGRVVSSWGREEIQSHWERALCFVVLWIVLSCTWVVWPLCEKAWALPPLSYPKASSLKNMDWSKLRAWCMLTISTCKCVKYKDSSVSIYLSPTSGCLHTYWEQ